MSARVEALARSPSVRERPWLCLLLSACSGVALGAAQLTHWLALSAWLGVALLSAALSLPASRRVRLGGTVLSAVVAYLVAFSWMIPCLSRYLGAPAWTAWLLTGGTAAVAGIVGRAPLHAGAALLRRGAPRWWLPIAWIAGDALLERAFEFSGGQILYGQWTVGPVLRLLALLGWYPTTALLVFAAAVAGEVTVTRRPRALVPLVAICALLWGLPPASSSDEALRGVGAVHLANITARLGAVPEGVDLLVWPEGASARRPALEEGEGPRDARIDDLPRRHGLEHIIGLAARSRRGPLNVAAHVGAEGRIEGVRAKSILVPGYERRLFGLIRVSDGEFVPGEAVPLLESGGHRIVPLVCYEVFHRPLVERGLAAGGRLLAVMASDRVLLPSAVAQEQYLAALVMRSVEYHLPAVRASLWGSAAVVTSDGRVLQRTAPGESGAIQAL